MSQLTLTTRTVRPVTTRVFIRKASEGVKINGETDGWEFDPRLKAEVVETMIGPVPALATISFAPPTGADKYAAFDRVLAEYSVDDQVQIVRDPIDDPGDQQPLPDGDDDGGQELVVFEGRLSRHVSNVNADARGASEVVGFVARPLCLLDNEGPDHLIRGMVATTGDAEFVQLESPFVPAVFNFNGRPNWSDEGVTAGVAGGGVDLDSGSFGDVYDRRSEPWTLARALRYLIVHHLVNKPGTEAAAPRNIDIDYDTASALAQTGGGRAPAFAGLDDELAELSVNGAGFLDAFARVCEAGNFQVGVRCLTDSQMEELHSDRRWQLSIWRRGTGAGVWLDLGKRGTSYQDAEAIWKTNNAPTFNGMRDAGTLMNEVTVVGRSYFVVRLPLKPLWSPDEEQTTPGDAKLQANPTEAQRLADSGYFSRHVGGGKTFDRYKHVFRRWGVDCFGGFNGYFEDPYKHDSAGFDFLAELGVLGIEGNIIRREREAANVTAPLKWMKRLRHLRPIMAAEAKKRGIRYLLDVSEDAGETWEPCLFNFDTLSDQCGIMLGVPNMAVTNNATHSTNRAPVWEKSWLKLILTKKLLFRVQATIEADTALLYQAKRRPTSGSKYTLADQVHVDAYEIWAQPETIANPQSLLFVRVDDRLPGEQTVEALQYKAAKTTAIRRQDRLDRVLVSLSADIPVMDFERYELGSRILGVRGRNVSFAGGADNYPTVIGIRYTLGDAQSIELSLDDTRFAGGR